MNCFCLEAQREKFLGLETLVHCCHPFEEQHVQQEPGLTSVVAVKPQRVLLYVLRL